MLFPVKYRDASAVVGYSAPYALYVHEDLEAYHTNGQAKYLEGPAKLLKADLAKYVVGLVKSGVPLKEALRRGCQLLLEFSRKLVPVRTGALRDSGFVEVE